MDLRTRGPVCDLSGVPFEVALHSGQETVHDLLHATTSLLGESFQVLDCASGAWLAATELVVGRCLWLDSRLPSVPVVSPDPVALPTVVVSPTEPFTVLDVPTAPMEVEHAGPALPADPWQDVLSA